MGSTLAGATTVLVASLRYWRTQTALRQSELGQRAGVHETSVRRGEAGQPLQLATVRKLAEALGVQSGRPAAPATCSVTWIHCPRQHVTRTVTSGVTLASLSTRRDHAVPKACHCRRTPHNTSTVP